MEVIKNVIVEIIYPVFFIIGIYQLNKYFHNIEVQLLFSNFCNANRIDKDKTLKKLQEEYYLDNKEALFTKTELKRYWKEPMAWH